MMACEIVPPYFGLSVSTGLAVRLAVEIVFGFWDNSVGKVVSGGLDVSVFDGWPPQATNRVRTVTIANRINHVFKAHPPKMIRIPYVEKLKLVS
jgi:hypothetical protein